MSVGERKVGRLFAGLALLLVEVAPAAAVPQNPGSATANNGSSRGALPVIDHLSCTGDPNEIRVVVRNVKQSVGLVTVELYENNQATFLTREGRVKRLQFAARAPETTFCVHAPEATDFAIGLYHDQNANNRIDKGSLGIPTEPYGVSNNPRMRFAAPTVAESLFHVPPEGVYLEINLKN
ncbi:MAG: DUF2141 domain-containing protein [Rhodomicrobium sp.]|nr:DUF2141 domain-containing protein [Rhodomicrobium sp.]